MKVFRPFLLIASLLLLVGMACLGSAPQPTAVPQEPTVEEQPTDVPEPTEESEPTEEPTEEAEPTEEPTEEPVAEEFYTEEFDETLSDTWEVFTVTGDDKADARKVKVEADNGKLVWDFDSTQVYYYLFNDAVSYEDVQLEVSADNRGRNNNSISLVCRHDPETGWYEFNIANSGVYNILYAEVGKGGKIKYNYIDNGGSLAIKQGKNVNEYGIICKGNELSLFINGEDVKTVKENKYALREGGVGISVSSFNVLPILIEMDWIKIIEP